MIPKANQRAGGQQLATHLLNEFDNDRVEVAEVRGAIAPDLHGAFAEWRAVAKATRAEKFLYSLSVNPDPQQRVITREEYYEYIRRVEKALDLAQQPRAVVFHVKHGREHCHVVWSRIDAEEMRAVQISHDRQKLRLLTREFARDHGLALPSGMREDRRSDPFNKAARRENLAEKQQEERSGIGKAERVDAITAAWRQSHDGASLVAALEARGYFLAQGDRRAYVVVDLYGEIHSLARQIEGIRAKELKTRLTTHPAERLPPATQAQEFARQHVASMRPATIPTVKAAESRLRADLLRTQTARRDELNKRDAAQRGQHRSEREALLAAQEAEDKGVISARLRAQPKGALAFVARITGIRLLLDKVHARKDQRRDQEHERQRAALDRRHERERLDFARHRRALDSLDKREQRSLETALKREEFRLAARPWARETPSLNKTVRAAFADTKPDEARAPQPAAPPRKDGPESVISAFFRQSTAGIGPAVSDEGRSSGDVQPAPARPGGTEDSGLREIFARSAAEEQTRLALQEWYRDFERRNRSRPGPDRER